MTREQMSEKIKMLGIDEPTKEQINLFMDSFNGEMKSKDEQIATLSANSEKVANLEKQLKDSTSAFDAMNTKYSELEKTMADKDSTIKGYEVSALKHKVAHEYGLSYDAVDFLKGDTEETIKDSADRFKSLVGQSRTIPEFKNEPEIKNSVNSSIKALAQSLTPKN